MPLFSSYKQIGLFVALFLLIFGVNLGLEYREFLEFKSKKYHFIDASLIQYYQKHNKNRSYYVMQFKASDFTFYTTGKTPPKCVYCEVGVVSSPVDFAGYLSKRVFLPSFKFNQIEAKPSLASRLKESITSMHEHPKMAELYSALYLATPISKDLRDNVTNWGIAHIIAISGFHLSVIFAICFFVARFSIAIIQDRYFPYFNLRFYLSILIFIAMGFYLYILDFTPSFLRSYIMGVVGFVLLSRGVKVFSFRNLVLAILIGVAFSPGLILSLGFYFSCLGVYFIFLYIRHFGDRQDLSSYVKIFWHILFLEIFVFCAMNLPVYYFFGSLSWYQISVIPLAYVFVIFYPLSVIFHLFGYGGIGDEYMLKFIEFAPRHGYIEIPFWSFILYNILAILAIWSRWIAIFVGVIGLIVYVAGLLW